MSANLQGKYRVEITNFDVVVSPISIKATPVAKRAYENTRFHVTLEIEDSDKDDDVEHRRDLVYNLPQEYVRSDDIVLTSPVAQAKFKLVLIGEVKPESAAMPLGE